jgi:hypothetical protein
VTFSLFDLLFGLLHELARFIRQNVPIEFVMLWYADVSVTSASKVVALIS